MSSEYDPPRPFRYDAGDARHVRCEVGETVPGRPVERPVTTVGG
jgi:hypothetical protein